MDEFDSILEIADAPLHQRVTKKFGNEKKRFYEESFSEDTNNKEKGSLSITPPPPYVSSDTEDSSVKAKSILNSIDNLLNPETKSSKNQTTKGKKSKEPVSFKASKRRVEATSKPAKPSKVYKDAEKIFNKQTDKTEVNKYMLVSIDPEVISSPPGAEILNLLSNPVSGKPEEIFKYRVENQRVPSTLTWKRKVLYLEDNQGEPVFDEHWIDEQRTLIFASAEEIALKIRDGSFYTWAQSIKSEYGQLHQLTLVIYDYNAYLKADKNAQERAKKAAVRGEYSNTRTNQNRVTEYDYQEALLTLSIDNILDFRTFDKATDKGWKDCAGLVFHHTRAIAEAPEKLKKNISSSAGFEFYAKADGKDSISPKNLQEYWKQVIMQVTSMSLEKANAIVLRYPSPSLLIQAYSNCVSPSEAELLLSNIEIRRVDTIIGGTRRLGDDLSRKIYFAFTRDDPLSLLAK